MENLFLSWKEFKKGKTKKSDVQQFEFDLEDNLFQLNSELTSKTYCHSDYTSFYITDPKLRHIHKACVRDRVLHHAIFRVLYPIFDRSFIFDSYSCRLGKGTHRAIKRLKQFYQKASQNNIRNIFALKCDVRKFFDSVGHDILLEIVRRKVADEKTIWLLKLIVGSYHSVSGKGLPIGNVTSQLFANIYLNELDQFVKHNLKLRYYLRYCDDFVILGESADCLKKIELRISKYLNNQLKLSLHPDKISTRKYRQGIDFLGYVVRPYYVTLRTKTKRRILKKCNADNLSSYLGVLKHCDGRKIKTSLLLK
ncbi:MAG: reverse transcriptase/maturase family protein [Minisyncoccia bacterium]